jgi:hypothetical protein
MGDGLKKMGDGLESKPRVVWGVFFSVRPPSPIFFQTSLFFYGVLCVLSAIPYSTTITI